MANLPETDFEYLVRQTKLIVSSYRHWLKKDLFPSDLPDEQLVREVFFAPFVVASAGTEADPILNYGNQKALELWEMDWKTFTQTPGRHTAEPAAREERQRFLDAVKKNGYVPDYRGIRISSTGKRFEIRKAVVWNLIGCDKAYAGQAVTFSDFYRIA